MTLSPLVAKVLERCEIGDCWIWTGSIASDGYGAAYVAVTYRQRGPYRARDYTHRIVWRELVGPIPAGLEIDHLCRESLCCNPDHLEPVTHRENMVRSKAWQNAVHRNLNGRSRFMCGKGLHLFSGDNVWVAGNGSRRCRPCKQEYERRKYWERKASA